MVSWLKKYNDKSNCCVNGFKQQNSKLAKNVGVYLTIVLLTFFLSNFVSAQEMPIVTLKQSAQQVWQRQQVLITLEVNTNDPFSRLEIDDFQQKGFSIIPYELQRTETKESTQLVIKWVIFPFVAGTQNLELPRVRYRPNSGRIKILDLKELSIQVRRLPVYVPPTMPVGKINLQSTWSESWLTTTNNLLEWQIMLDGIGVAKQTMPPVTRQIMSTDSLQILPIQSFQKAPKTERGITNKLHYKIPLKATKSGKLALPKVEIQYFEPLSGKLQMASLSPPFVLSLNKWLLWLIALLILFVAVVLFILLVYFLKQALRKSALRKNILNQLSQATNYQQVRDALNQLALTHGWGKNMSLSKFLLMWELKFGKSHGLTEAISALQAQKFSLNEISEIKSISQDLIKIIIRK